MPLKVTRTLSDPALAVHIQPRRNQTESNRAQFFDQEKDWRVVTSRDNISARGAVLERALRDLGDNRFARVKSQCAALIHQDANDVEALLLSGLAAGARGRLDHAARLLLRAAGLAPTKAHPLHDLAALLQRTGQTALLEPQFQALRRLAPEDASLWEAFGESLHDRGQNEAACSVLAEAKRLAPDKLPVRNLLAMALAAAGHTDAAIEELRRAIALNASHAGLWANLGLLLKDDGRSREALTAYDHALMLAPHDARIRVNRVVALLRSGRWTEAWRDFEWRLDLEEHAALRPCLLPSLTDVPNLSGLRVLAEHEDGFGDSLHFARYLPILAERGAHVSVLVPTQLIRIMRTVPGVASVFGPADPPPRYDYYCPFFSLPRAFATTPDTIPAPIPYLRADPASATAWRARLPSGVLLAGLAWAGQARPQLAGFMTLDARRSMALATLAPLAAVPEVAFVSLQFGPEAAQARSPPDGMTLFDPMAGVADFADTAAIIANLDLVISVDTSVVHLAGGMGKPVFLLDRYDHCWRWLDGRADSPWYPGMRIFRQPRIGDWDTVLREALSALREFATVRRSRLGRSRSG